MEKTIKHIVAIVVLSLMALATQAQGYVTLSSVTQYSSSNQNDYSSNQKIRSLTADTTRYLILSQLTNGQSRLSYIDEASATIKRVYMDFPSQYKVNDFEVFNNNVYFCGQYNNTCGFVGYISQANLITPSPFYPRPYKIYNVSQVTKLTKIKPFSNGSNTTSFACIGEIPLLGFTYSCLVVGNTLPTQLSFPLSFATNYSIYRANNDINHDMFNDLAITDNYICIVSNNILAKNQGPGENETFQKMIVHRLNRNNPSTQITNTLLLGTKPMFNEQAVGGGLAETFQYKMETLSNDDVAIGYSAVVAVDTPKVQCAVVYKVDLSTLNDTMQIKQALLFDRATAILKIYDIKAYNDNLLLVRSNAVFNIRISNVSSFPYNSTAYYVGHNLSSVIFRDMIISRGMIDGHEMFFPETHILTAGICNWQLTLANKNITRFWNCAENCFTGANKVVETFNHNTFINTGSGLTPPATYSVNYLEKSFPTQHSYSNSDVTTLCN